jgi:hypothetical protein
VRLRHEPGEDDDAMRPVRQPLGQNEQRRRAVLVRNVDEHRPFRCLRLAAGGRYVHVERRVLPEDRPLELLQRRARLEPEFVDEDLARVAVDVERLRLPARAVERRHERQPRALAERVLGHEGLELGHRLAVAPEREVGVEAELERRETDLLEPDDRGLREALVGDVGERRTAPQRQRLAEPRRGLGRHAAGEQAPSLVHEPLEAVEVEFVRPDPHDVPRRARRQHVLRERLAQPRHVDPQRRGGTLRRLVPPQFVDQPLRGDDLVGMQQEHREQRPGPATAKRHGTAVDAHLERPQDPELHPPASRRATLHLLRG